MRVFTGGDKPRLHRMMTIKNVETMKVSTYERDNRRVSKPKKDFDLRRIY